MSVQTRAKLRIATHLAESVLPSDPTPPSSPPSSPPHDDDGATDEYGLKAFVDVYYTEGDIWVDIDWTSDEGVAFGSDYGTYRWASRWHDSYADPKYGAKDSITEKSWPRMMKKYNHIIEQIANMPVAGVDYGDRLMVMDVEWHLDQKFGPISQIACSSMDGLFEYNQYIKYKDLHPDWRALVEADIVEISPWDATDRSVSLYAALTDLFTRVPIGSIFIYHGSKDHSALTWNIHYLIADDAQHTSLVDLMRTRKIKFASSAGWLLMQYDNLNIREYLFPTKEDKEPYKGYGDLGLLYNRIFVDHDEAEQVGEYEMRNVPQIQKTINAMMRQTTRPAVQLNAMKTTTNKRYTTIKVAAHEAGTDGTALKLVMLVLAVASDAHQRSPVKGTIRRRRADQWPLVRLIARTMCGDSPRDLGLHGNIYRAPLHASAYMWGYFNDHSADALACPNKKQKQYDADRIANKRRDKPAIERHADGESAKFAQEQAVHYKHIERDPNDDIIQGDRIDFHHNGLEMIEGVMTDEYRALQAEWCAYEDRPLFCLGVRLDNSAVFTVHCKHCPSVAIRKGSNHPAIKKHAWMIDTAKNSNRLQFCKICKKYEGDQGDACHSSLSAIPAPLPARVAVRPPRVEHAHIGRPSDSFMTQWCALFFLTTTDVDEESERTDRLYVRSQLPFTDRLSMAEEEIDDILNEVEEDRGD